MIPQNTNFITKEMMEQFEIEQTVIQKELEKYNSWFTTIKFQIVSVIGKLKFLKKAIKTLRDTSLYRF